MLRRAAHLRTLGGLEKTMPKAIHTFSPDDTTRTYAWARYVFWAEVEGRQYDAYERTEDESPLGLGTVLMLHFYSALWVAIEAWRSCPLTDETIDELLTDPAFEQNVRLLRRFRNGVYHYQPDLINERVLAFLREGEHAVIWAFLLHDEFKRVVWEMAHPSGISPNLQDELEDAIEGIVGWLPEEIAEAAPHRAGKRHRETAEMIMKSGGRNTAEARALLAAVNHARSVAHEVSSDWTRQKRAMIEALKSQRRDLSD
jgi:hypothetical protein